MTRFAFASAFTLIELLVVVTIIVVLLALLTPALDKAIYQAEMAADAANMKGIATGTLTYTSTHRRWYPDRFAATNAAYMAQWMASGSSFDDRRKLYPFMGANMMNDPFCEKVDFGLTASDADTNVAVDYDLYFGYRFFEGGATALPGMFRMGDKVRWSNTSSSGTKEYNFDILVTEHDRIAVGSFATSAHPDRDGKLAPSVWQNRYQFGGVAGVGVGKWTLSRWEGSWERGLVDYQAAMQGGDVRRYLDVAWDAWQTNPDFTQVPNYTNAQSFATEYHNIPVR